MPVPCEVWASSSLDAKNVFLSQTAIQAAQSSFCKISPDQKRPYLSPSTFSLVQQLAQLTSPDQLQQRRSLRNRIKTCARRDKKQWWADSFQLDSQGPPSQQWKTIRQARSSFKARPTNIVDIRGRLRPRNQRSEVFCRISWPARLETKILTPTGRSGLYI